MRAWEVWAILPTVLDQLKTKKAAQSQTDPLPNGGNRLSQLPASYSIQPIQTHRAILPITGVILPQDNLWSQLMGATTLDTFTQDLQQALGNPAISEIILAIDSPGGVVTGVHECAEMIYQARGQKPITAYIAGMGASAAYWLASACDEIVLDATASVGSIGVLSLHTDDKARKAKAGLSQIQIVSRQSPKKRLDITTDEGRAAVQAQVDAIAEVFVTHVARNRHVSIETVLADFGQGSLCVGIQAVKQGLADRLSTWAQLIQAKTPTSNLSTKKLSHPPHGAQTMTEILTEVALPQITADYLAKHHAEVMQDIQQMAAKAECARIQAVENQLIPGHEALIEQLKFDGKTTGAEAALQVLAAEKARCGAKRKQISAESLPALPIACSVTEAPGFDRFVSKKLPDEEQWRLNWQKESALQAEFGRLETYVAFMQAEANGQVNRLNRTEPSR